MGFYGNVFYELSNAFASILIKSKYGDKELKASGIGGSFTIGADNEWINLDADENSRRFSISHANISKNREGTSFIPLQKETSSPSEKIDLKAGDIIKVPQLTYDKAGHIIKVDNSTYFKLPINETEANIQQLQEDMTLLKKAEDGQNSKISILEGKAIQYDKDIEQLKNMETTVTNTEKQSNTNKNNITTLTEFIGAKTDLTNEDSVTITKTIGNVDNVLKNYADISDGIMKLTDAINGANITIGNTGIATKSAINKLCEKINSYKLTDNEGNLIEIDPDELWTI